MRPWQKPLVLSRVVAPAVAVLGTDVLALALLICALLWVWIATEAISSNGSDYYQNWVVGKAIRANSVENIYSNTGRDQLKQQAEYDAARSADDHEKTALQINLNYTHLQRREQPIYLRGTPFLHGLTGAIPGRTFDESNNVFRALCLLSMLIGVLMFSRLLNYSFSQAVLAASFFIGLFDPFFNDFLSGNMNALQLGWLAVVVWIYTQKSRFWGGLLLGLLEMFKPNFVLVPIAIIVAEVTAGRSKLLYSAGCGFIIGSLIAFAAGSAMFGNVVCWWNWITNLRAGLHVVSVASGNFCLVRMVDEWWHIDLSIPMLLILLSCLTAVLYASRAASLSSGRTLMAVCLSLGMMLFCAPEVWRHYFVCLCPLMLFLLHPPNKSCSLIGTRWVAIACCVVFSVGAPLTINLAATDNNHFALVLVYYAAALALLVAGMSYLLTSASVKD